MFTTYLYKYNNFFNRIVKKLDNLSDYDQYMICNPVTNQNFNMNDGINATLVLNIYDKSYFNGEPDYMIAYNQDKETFTRWFVLEFRLNSSNQYVLTVKRDVIADNLEAVMNADCFIEKGMVQPDNNLIFNKEGMTFDQIKTKEILIQDNLKTPWIIGYCAHFDGENKVTSWDDVFEFKRQKYDFIINSNAADWKYSKYINTNPAIAEPSVIQYHFNTYYAFSNNQGSYDVNDRKFYFDDALNYSYSDKQYGIQAGETEGFPTSPNIGGYKLKYANGPATIASEFSDYFEDMYDFTSLRSEVKTAFNITSDANDIIQYNNKVIRFNDGIYKCVITSNPITYTESITSTIRISLFNLLKTNTDSLLTAIGFSENEQYTFNGSLYIQSPFGVNFSTTEYYVILSKINNDDIYAFSIPTTRQQCQDSPYDLFAIPMNSVTTDTGMTTISSDITMGIANLISAGASDYLYDIQLLPYCPMPSIINSKGQLAISSLEETVDYTFIKKQSGTGELVNYGLILFPQKSSFSTVINLSEDDIITVNEPKIESECDIYRLCSPNYNGIFEIDAAMNDGIKYFEVNCTYIPQNPYIHLNPNFGRMYGGDFNDNRGLICGGDFSLPMLKNSWTDYQLQNKNYQQSFDRDIKNMKEQTKHDFAKNLLSAGGNLAGSIVTGNVGGIINSGTQIVNSVTTMAQGQREIANKKDQFNFQLGNIKALPNSLSRTTAYTLDNKYFPFLEYYTCSEEQKQALRDKITYEGMTIGVIGKIADYSIGSYAYVRSNLIRLDNLGIFCDAHLLYEINDRLSSGLYFQ